MAELPTDEALDVLTEASRAVGDKVTADVIEALRAEVSQLLEIVRRIRVVAHLYPEVKKAIASYDAASPRTESPEVRHG